MGKRSTPVERHPANLTIEQIKRGIPRIEKRIADLEAFNPATLNERFPPEVTALKARIEQTLSDVFGPNSLEYHPHQAAAVSDSSRTAAIDAYGRSPRPQDNRAESTTAPLDGRPTKTRRAQRRRQDVLFRCNTPNATLSVGHGRFDVGVPADDPILVVRRRRE